MANGWVLVYQIRGFGFESQLQSLKFQCLLFLFQSSFCFKNQSCKLVLIFSQSFQITGVFYTLASYLCEQGKQYWGNFLILSCSSTIWVAWLTILCKQYDGFNVTMPRSSVNIQNRILVKIALANYLEKCRSLFLSKIYIDIARSKLSDQYLK